MQDNIVPIRANALTAPLTNVTACAAAVQHALARDAHLPGFVVLYGPSGWGKTKAAAFCANNFRAYYVEAKSTWTRKALLLYILKEMGIEPAKTHYAMAEQVAEQLALSGRPLIIDEMDYLVKKGIVEVVRDLYQGSNGTVLLVGEELLPGKLKAWERFHNRVLEWVPAQPCDLQDAQALAALYARNLEIADDLLSACVEKVKGNTRRVCVNIEHFKSQAINAGVERMDLSWWGGRGFDNGEPAPRRL